MDSLKKSFEFKRVYSRGKKINTKHLTLYVKEENLRKHIKLGIVIKKKIGNAVHRNRLRRILKESFRDIEKKANANLKILAVFKKVEGLNPFELKSYNMKSEIESFMKKWLS